MPADTPLVGLFVTCLVDLYRPSVGLAAASLIERAGCRVHVPRLQTCCGQPAYNSGDRRTAIDLAREIVVAFSGCDHVVVPSGSCAGMLSVHLPRLLEDDPRWADKARAFAARTHELTAFLVDIRGVTVTGGAGYTGTVTYHDSCSALRELKVRAQPRQLLAGLAGVTLAEMADTESCCGFGGTFCVKYPEISDRMVAAKVEHVTATGADTLLAGDMGCLLNLAGKLARLDSPVAVRHVAEVLADEPLAAPIGRR